MKVGDKIRMALRNFLHIEPAQQQFIRVDEELDFHLRECMANRNKKSWLAYCSDICKNFSLSSFSEFYEPNLAKIYTFNYYMNKKLTQRKEEEYKKQVIPLETKMIEPDRRLLEEIPVLNDPYS